jgi:BirA family biotin operon repressor/biotin-[acetyl-CoA-carboxylase] ligase
MADGFLDAEELLAATFVRNVEVHETLGSTNDRAVELARDQAIKTPALIVARFQIAGRGRGGNMWWSADGALTFSLLLDSRAIGISTRDWPRLSLATAVALCDSLELRIADCGLRINTQNVPPRRPTIKWPNDVYIDDKKVAGILIESPAATAPLKNQLIIGVGINVNNSWRDAPSEIAPLGTALCDITGTRHDLQVTLVDVLQAMGNRFTQLACDDPHLPQTWQRLCWLKGYIVEVQTNGSRTSGICAGIDIDGALLLNNTNGMQRLRSGSIQTIRQTRL